MCINEACYSPRSHFRFHMFPRLCSTILVNVVGQFGFSAKVMKYSFPPPCPVCWMPVPQTLSTVTFGRRSGLLVEKRMMAEACLVLHILLTSIVARLPKHSRFRIHVFLYVCILATWLNQRNTVAFVEGSHRSARACVLAIMTGVPLVRLSNRDDHCHRRENVLSLSATYLSQARATLQLLEMFHWTNVVLVYEGESLWFRLE